jgi:predicted N-formylglutamate amidohydrolase
MSEQTGILTVAEGMAVSVENASGTSPVLLVCEHASLTLPAALGTLGLSEEARSAHIAWDPGALAISRQLSSRFDATLIFQNFSRLAYDCNRPPESPDAMPAISEIYEIPGNRNIGAAERQTRIDGIYRPWQRALAEMIAARNAAGRETIIVTIHTFTPIYKGAQRSVEIGILHDRDARLADAVLARAARGTGFRFERNQPYGPADGVTHTLVEHGLANGLLNVMIEVRNDLVKDEIGQARVSSLLEALVSGSLEDILAAENFRGNSKVDATS